MPPTLPSGTESPSRPLLQRLRDYWVEAPNANPLVDQSLARAYVVDTRDTPLSAAVTAAVFWILFLVLTGDRGTLVWAVLVHAMQWNMHRHLHRLDPAAIDAASAARTRRRLELRMLFPGLVWSLAPWLFFPHGDLAYILLMYFFVSGATSVIIAALAQWWLAALCFGVPVFLSLALRLVLEPGSVTVIMGCLAVSQLVAALHYARKQNRLIVGSIENGFENARLAEALRRQLEHVAQLAAQRARIFAAANHDLRQPVMAIGLQAEVLRQQLESGADTHAVQHTVASLARAQQALEGLTNQLLEIGRIEAAVDPLRPEAVALAPLLQELARQAGNGRVGVRCPTNAVAWTDTVSLRRVLANLVDNAVKFTPRGRVLLAVRTRERESGRAWRIEVRDSGIGIPADAQERVFNDFEQIGNVERNLQRGHGLGLAIVRRLAAQLGIEVALRSAPGRGSVFSFELPAAPEGAAVARIRPLPQAGTGASHALPSGLAVLVVEDNAVVADSLLALLRQWGVAPRVYASAAEALALADLHALDAALCDIRLPGALDGIALAERLQRQKPSLTIVLISADINEATQRLALERGWHALRKPVQPDELHGVLLKALPRG